MVVVVLMKPYFGPPQKIGLIASTLSDDKYTSIETAELERLLPYTNKKDQDNNDNNENNDNKE